MYTLIKADRYVKVNIYQKSMHIAIVTHQLTVLQLVPQVSQQNKINPTDHGYQGTFTIDQNLICIMKTVFNNVFNLPTNLQIFLLNQHVVLSNYLIYLQYKCL